jgi:hypothetical protein
MGSNIISPCSFKLRGTDSAVKNWFVGEVLTIELSSPTQLGVFDKDGNQCGYLPYFLNDMLFAAIASSPDGKFTCEVDRVWPYERDGLFGKEERISVSCKLHENPALPEMLDGHIDLLVYASIVKGIEHKQERERSFTNIMHSNQLPPIVLQRDRANTIDTSAILIFALMNGKRLELGYVDGKDTTEICQHAAVGKKLFARLTNLKVQNNTYIANYEIVLAETNSEGFEALL